MNYSYASALIFRQSSKVFFTSVWNKLTKIKKERKKEGGGGWFIDKPIVGGYCKVVVISRPVNVGFRQKENISLVPRGIISEIKISGSRTVRLLI